MSLTSILPQFSTPPVELHPTELARIELCAVDGYGNPAYPEEVRFSAADKARQRVVAVYAAVALDKTSVPRWVSDWSEANFQNPTGGTLDEEAWDTMQVTPTITPGILANRAREYAETLREWRTQTKNRPEYTPQEAAVVNPSST
jgi:hypothetical protein